MFLLIKYNCAKLSCLSALRSLFAKKSTTSPLQSLIGSDVVISGRLKSAGDVYLLGRIKGKVECCRLFMSEEARACEIVSTTDIILSEKNT